MAQVTTIALKNNAAVVIPFNREQGLPDGVVLRDSTETTLGRAARLRITTRMPTPSSKVARIKQTFTQPVYDVSGVLLRTLTKHEEWIIPAEATQTERNEFDARTQEASKSAVVTAFVRNLDFAS